MVLAKRSPREPAPSKRPAKRLAQPRRRAQARRALQASCLHMRPPGAEKGFQSWPCPVGVDGHTGVRGRRLWRSVLPRRRTGGVPAAGAFAHQLQGPGLVAVQPDRDHGGAAGGTERPSADCITAGPRLKRADFPVVLQSIDSPGLQHRPGPATGRRPDHEDRLQ